MNHLSFPTGHWALRLMLCWILSTNLSSMALAADPPQITITRDTTLCIGNELQLQVTSSDTPSFFEWEESRVGLSCYNCSVPIASPTVSTTYVVKVTGPTGESTVDSVRITVLQEDSNILGADRTICEDSEAILEISGGADAQWSPASGLSCTTCPTPIAQPSETTTYTVQATGPLGCILTDSIKVIVQNKEDIDAGPDVSICEGNSITLEGQLDPGGAQWWTNGRLVASGAAEPSVNPSENTTYVYQSTIDQCVLTDTLLVTVNGTPDIFPEDITICKGKTAELLVETNANTFRWWPSAGLSATDVAQPMASPSATTTYTIIASIDDCSPDSATLTVEVQSAPEVSVQAPSGFVIGDRVNIITTTPSTEKITYQWTPVDYLSCSDCPSPVATPNRDITYQLIASTKNTCADTVEVALEILDQCSDNTILLPTAFSPNQDGENDQLFVRGEVELSTFRVFNRWGQMVFETQNINFGWDGSQNGQKLNPGIYVYVVEGFCPYDGRRISKTGDVMLLR